ncbi:M56 family metallopeptidase [Geminocystis sp. GBBB08]|uniref:M56 family metallopeptidase n=1 Tax=Geminocystis sp. GBBB08 TaxID=2604140 RepID=UPI0027E2FC38|nr:M56 family metallopeptidase [Geminocystis sp. GBBB08]MBL1210551.1 M56 family metallopeptidase [Geminocystis sp. GBBB08]
MHFIFIFSALFIAYSIRLISQLKGIKYQKNWGLSLFLFGFPPLLLLMTCVTVFFMGYHGEMWGIKASKFSYYLSVSFLVFALFTLIKITWDLQKLFLLIRKYPLQNIGGKNIKILQTSFPYAAQVGFWRSQLVMSSGLIKLLSKEHLNAVIAHESAHEIHKDTFFFFWLSYLERLTFWLPNNENLWSNLLLLRELRADNTAAKTVDYLLIAEALLTVTTATINAPKPLTFNLECPFTNCRLEERIENLLDNSFRYSKFNWQEILWLILIFIPWIFFPFHNPCS